VEAGNHRWHSGGHEANRDCPSAQSRCIDGKAGLGAHYETVQKYGDRSVVTHLEGLNMPIYEYLCLDCKKPFSFLVGVIADSGEPRCTRCDGKKLRKLISRVARVRSKESSLEDLADPSKLGDMDDPKAMARWAKEMGKSMADETGEELPEDFDQMMEEGPGGEADEE
jgi:putative FmdB family regulatory protein